MTQGLQVTGSVVVAHGLSGSEACGIFPDQGSNPCRLSWQMDSYPLYHQEVPTHVSLMHLIRLWLQGRHGNIPITNMHNPEPEANPSVSLSPSLRQGCATGSRTSEETQQK